MMQSGGFSPADLFTGSETGVVYDVSDLSSMNTEPDQSGSVPAVGDVVRFIADKSGNGNDAQNNSSSASPVLRQDANSRYYLEFDGINDSLVTQSNINVSGNSAREYIGAFGPGGVVFTLNPEGGIGERWTVTSYQGNVRLEIENGAYQAGVSSDGVVGIRLPDGGTLGDHVLSNGTTDENASGSDIVNTGISPLYIGHYDNAEFYGCTFIDKLLTAQQRADARQYYAEKRGVAIIAPTIIASDSLSGRTLTITVDSTTGVPAPTTALTALTLDGVEVRGDATGSDPWAYEAPDSADVQTVAWTVEASNAEGIDTASGSETVGANLFAPTITSAPQITGDPVAGETVTITNATASGTPTPTVTPTLALGGTDVTGDISGGQYTIPPSATVGQTLTLTSVASNGVSPDAQDSVSVTVQDGGFSPADLFTGSEAGAWYGPSDLSTLFQDSAGTTPVTVATDPIGYVGDKSGNDNHATQATAAARPTYQTGPARATLDKVDDRLSVTVPTGGFTGTMVLATDQGTASYGVTIPAGAYAIGGRGGQHFPGNAIVGQLIRDGALSAGDAAATEAYFVENGATASYGAVTDFSSYWRGWSEITSFPLIDTSSGTDFSLTWFNCTSLTSFPLIDTSSGTNFNQTWRGCNSLTSFPLIDTSSGTNFDRAWYNCTGLTSFPLIDTSSGTNFFRTWYNCSSLTSFPLIDTSSGTSFNQTWYNCSSLTSFPLIDTSAGTDFFYAWYNCSSLTSFPLIDTSAGTRFNQTWRGCNSLTSFPANAFDNVKGGNFTDAFRSTALTQTSIDNILVSLVASGIAAGTRVFDQSGGSAPSSTGEAAIDTLRSRGWTVTVTGGYSPTINTSYSYSYRTEQIDP
jgi:hypothetical protein